MKLTQQGAAVGRMRIFTEDLVVQHPQCDLELRQQLDAFEFLLLDEREKQIEWDSSDIALLENEFRSNMEAVCNKVVLQN